MAQSINITEITKGKDVQGVKITGGDLYSLLHHPLLDARNLSIWVPMVGFKSGLGIEVAITKQEARRAFTYSKGDNVNEIVINSLFAVGDGKFGLRING